MGTVLSPADMRRIRSESDARSEIPRAAIMDEVRSGLYRFGDLQMLSNRTGISLSCLNAIRSGRTKWPRPTTIFTILPYLGLALTVTHTTQH